MAKGLIPNKRRGQPWRARIRYADGSTRVVSTGYRDARAALSAKRRLEREAADPLYAPTRPLELGEMIVEFLDSRRRAGGLAGHGCAHATLKLYAQKAGHLVRLLGEGRDVQRLRLVELERYVELRLAEGACDHTVSKELAVLRGALRRARRAGEFRGELEALLPRLRAVYAPRTRFLSRGELGLLLAELPLERAELVSFLVLTGARWGEAMQCERRHVHLEQLLLELPGSKTLRAARAIPIAPELAELLAAILATARHALGAPSVALFRGWGNVGRDLKAACARAAIEPVTPNDLRRTFATWLWQGGVSPARIARLLGHRDSTMVERVYGQLQAQDLAPDVTRALAGVARRAA